MFPLKYNGRTYSHGEYDGVIEFYESGSLKLFDCGACEVEVYGDTLNYLEVNINDAIYNVARNQLDVETQLTFYDSGSIDKLIVQSFVLCEDTIVKNDIGDFNMAKGSRITLDKEGKIISGALYKSSDMCVKVNGYETYVRGEGEYDKYIKGNYSCKGYCPVEFYNNQALKSFVLDDVVMTKIDGADVILKGGTYVELWEDGSIRECVIGNDTTLKIGNTNVKVYLKDSKSITPDGSYMGNPCIVGKMEKCVQYIITLKITLLMITMRVG